MPRELPEWTGSTDSTPIPQRVRLRVFQRDQGRCQCGCYRPIRPGEDWQIDHRLALINGGKNTESNLFTLLIEHHANKTKADVAEKSKVYQKQSKHLGIKKRYNWPGGKNSPWRKKVNGQTVRR